MFDKQETDGSRIIRTEKETLYMNWSNGAKYFISTIVVDDQPQFFIWLDLGESEILKISKGRILLLKFKDGSTIELINEMGTYSLPQYKLSEEQILKLAENELVKIRIEHDTGYIDRNIKKFNKKFKDIYKLINERLSEKQSIYDNF